MSARTTTSLWQGTARKRFVDSFTDITLGSEEEKLLTIKKQISDLLLPDVSKAINERISRKEGRSVDREVLRIFYPSDPEYDNQRTYFSQRIQQRPLMIIQPASDKEVVRVLNWVNGRRMLGPEATLTARVVGGRHSTQLLNPDILIDISLFDDISLCLETNYVKVGGGQTQGAVNTFLFDQSKFKEAASTSRFDVLTNSWFAKPRSVIEPPSNLFTSTSLDLIIQELTPQDGGAIDTQKIIQLVDSVRHLPQVFPATSSERDDSAAFESTTETAEGLLSLPIQDTEQYTKSLLGLCDLSEVTVPDVYNAFLQLGAQSLKYLDTKLFHQKANKLVGHVYSDFGHFERGPIFSDALKTNAFAGGSAASVGVGGISCAGGVGTLKRSYGLTVDHIKNITIVISPDANNQSAAIKTVSRESKTEADKELFWALLGGGANNFGIVTSITFQILPNVPQVLKYWYKQPFACTGEIDLSVVTILSDWAKTSDCRPPEFNEQLDIIAAAGGVASHTISVSGFYLLPRHITDYEAAVEAIKSEFRTNSIGVPAESFKFDTKLIDYSDTYNKLVDDRTYRNFSIIQAFFVDGFEPTRVLNYFREMLPLKDGSKSISFELMGGEIAKYAEKDEKAIKAAGGNVYAGKSFAASKTRFFLDISANWDSVEFSQEREQWIRTFVDDTVNHGLLNTLPDKTDISVKEPAIAYVGFPITFPGVLNENNKDEIYYGKVNFPELVKVKQANDPQGNFTPCGTLPNIMSNVVVV